MGHAMTGVAPTRDAATTAMTCRFEVRTALSLLRYYKRGNNLLE
jgi:hypothetical protein